MSPRIALLAALLAAGPASAAQVPFEASLAVQIATLPAVVFTGSGIATVNGSGGGSHLGALALPAGAAGTAGLILPVTDPAAFPIAGVQVTAANGTGGFAETGGGTLTGMMPILGVAKVCLFAACGAPPPANLSVPLTPIGAGGSKAVSFAVNMTVFGAPWTTGVAAVGTITQMGLAHGPASLASSTAALSGVVRLVTPIFLTTNIGASVVIPAFATLTLHFVPEPGTLMLLAAGIGGLLLMGRSRETGT